MKRIPNFVIISLLTVLAITGCTVKESAGWEEQREQANNLYNEQKFDEALTIYEQALEKADADGRLKLRQDIIDCHLAVGHDHEARQLMLALMPDAASQGNRYVEAETKFALGEQLCQAGDKAAGYPYMHEAVGLMSQCKDSDAPYTLTFYHYRLMKRAAEDEDYPLAIAESKLTEQVWRTLSDTARAERLLRPALALRAYFYLKTDSTAKADETYRQWQQHLPCSIAEEYHINYYLTERGRYADALDIYRRYEAYTLEKKGYWSMDEEVAKLNIADIYARMGDSAQALRLTKEVNDYLNRKRIALACQLMQQHPNWTVETIAQDCGFQTVRTFNRVFKTATDMTPTQYISMAEGTKG